MELPEEGAAGELDGGGLQELADVSDRDTVLEVQPSQLPRHAEPVGGGASSGQQDVQIDIELGRISAKNEEIDQPGWKSPVPAKFGKSHANAKDALVDGLETILETQWGARQKIKPFNVFKIVVFEWWAIAAFFSVFALWLNYGFCSSKFYCDYGLMEGFLVLILFVILGLFFIAHTYRTREEHFVRVSEVLAALKSAPTVSSKHWDAIHTRSSRLPSLILAYRNGAWQPVPVNFLIHGDIIVVHGGEKVKVAVEIVYPPAAGALRSFQAGDVVPNAATSIDSIGSSTERAFFAQLNQSAGSDGVCIARVTGRSPLFSCIEEFLENSVAHFSLTLPRLDVGPRQHVSRYLKFTMLACVAVGLVANVVRLAIDSWGMDWSDLLFARQAYIVLSILPLTLTIWEPLLYIWATAKLLALHEQLQKREHYLSRISATVDMEERQQLKERIGNRTERNVSTGRIFKLFLRLLRVRHEKAFFSSNNPGAEQGRQLYKVSTLLQIPLISRELLGRLARTTALSGLDEQVVLKHYPMIEEAFLLGGERGETVLDVCERKGALAKRGAVTFEDPKWTENLALLKPMALSCTLSSTHAVPRTRAPQRHPLGLQQLARHFESRVPPTHLVRLGEAIGFREADLRHYVPCDLFRILDDPLQPVSISQTAISPGFHGGRSQMSCLILETDHGVQMMQRKAHRARKQQKRSPQESTVDNAPEEEGENQPEPRSAVENAADNQRGAKRKNKKGRTGAAAHHGPLPYKRSLFMLTWGDPNLVASCCPEYWSGDSIWPLGDAERDKIIKLCQTWRNENFDQVAFAFAPIPWKSSHHFRSPRTLAQTSIYLGDQSGGSGSENTAQRPGSGEARLAAKRQFLQELIPTQVFTGLVGSREQPRPSLSGLIEDLDTAGIRFIYFSRRNPRQSRVLADKMGLETGWNTSISLKELPPRQHKSASPADPEGSSPIGPSEEDRLAAHRAHDAQHERSYWDEKARLPHGIEEIRHHIKEIDDVPLRISTFTDSTSESSREMIEILQENGEFVSVFGTALNAENLPCFCQADLVVAVQSRVFVKDSGSLDKVRLATLDNPANAKILAMPAIIQLELSAAFNAVHSSLVLDADESLSVIADLIGEARILVSNYRQVLTVFVAGHLVLAGMVTFSYFFAIPSIVTYYYIAWLAWIQVPLLAIPFISNRPRASMMTELPSKNDQNHKKNILATAKRCLQYSVYQLFPTCVVLVMCFIWHLDQRCGREKWPVFLWQVKYTQFGPQLNCLTKDNVLLAQMLTLFSFVWYFIFITSTYSNRHVSFIKEPLSNGFWYLAAIIAILLQIAFSEAFLRINVGNRHVPLHWLSSAPSYFWLVFFLWPLVIVLSSEVLKIEDRKFHERKQMRLRVVYETRLGMYSPK